MGNASYICKAHKSAFKTVKVSTILASVEKALESYPGYVGNKIQHEEIKTQEDAARAVYSEDKSKKRILMSLDWW